MYVNVNVNLEGIGNFLNGVLYIKNGGVLLFFKSC